MPSAAAVAAAASRSTSETGRPASRKHIAMPRPMVPPPMTATLRTSVAAFASTSAGSLAQARSAKKSIWSALDCGPAIKASNLAASKARPASKGSLDAASTHSTMSCGAMTPRGARRRAAENTSAPTAGITTPQLLRNTPGLRSLTMRMASSSSSAPSGTSASIQPISTASAAEMWRPLRMRLSAFSAPTSRGSRCVPPAPGSSPRWTSGKPTFAVFSATRIWQLSASSKPPPSAVPWIAAIVGTSHCS
mmetsp:Transcript_9434/g.31183  ORF Transcript_9434/g.31183 Transcript_9434/m.31183 type:complete len:249 (-) Transcript_9434:213-959(-)